MTRSIYAAHITTGESHALGDPEIVIEHSIPGDVGTPWMSTPYADTGDPLGALADLGWRPVGDHATALSQPLEPGYHIIPVEPRDWPRIIEHLTRRRLHAEGELRERDDVWRDAISEAITTTRQPIAIAEAAQITKSRVYQIRDEHTPTTTREGAQ